VLSLIDISKLHLVSGYLLHLFRRASPLSAILLIGRRDVQGKQLPRLSTAACTFAPLRRLAPSYPARAPDSGVD